MENKDPRIDEVKKIVESLVTKSLWEYTSILVTPTNLNIIVTNTLLYDIPLKNQGGQIIGFNNYKMLALDENPIVFPYDRAVTRNILDTVNGYKNLISVAPIVARDDALRGNVEFEKLLELKSDQGLKYFKMPSNSIDGYLKTYIVPIFAGFPNMNKQDDIGILIYDIDDFHLLINMKIMKKKINRNIDLYFRTLKT